MVQFTQKRGEEGGEWSKRTSLNDDAFWFSFGWKVSEQTNVRRTTCPESPTTASEKKNINITSHTLPPALRSTCMEWMLVETADTEWYSMQWSVSQGEVWIRLLRIPTRVRVPVRRKACPMLNYHFRDVPSRIGDGVLAALLRKISVEKHIFYTPLASFSKNFLVHVFHVPFKGVCSSIWRYSTDTFFFSPSSELLSKSWKWLLSSSLRASFLGMPTKPSQR